MPFVRSEMSITAAGTDDDRRAGGFIGGRLIELHARNVFRSLALRARRALLPQGNRRRLVRSLGRRLIRVLSKYTDGEQEQSKICHHEFHHSASLLKSACSDGKPQRKPSSLLKRRTARGVQKIVNRRGCYIARDRM